MCVESHETSLLKSILNVLQTLNVYPSSLYSISHTPQPEFIFVVVIAYYYLKSNMMLPEVLLSQSIIFASPSFMHVKIFSLVGAALVLFQVIIDES